METKTTFKNCPFCAEQILVEARKCKHCNEMLSTTNHQKSNYNYSDYNEPRNISTTEKVGFSVGKNLKTSLVLIIIFIAAILAINYYQNNSSGSAFASAIISREKSPEELRAELLEKERNNPEDYLEDNTSMRANLIGQKVIEGTITNNASIAVFKDHILNVTFLSKTESELETQQFKVYEVIAPGKSVSFKFKTSAPKETRGFSASIIGAIPTN